MSRKYSSRPTSVLYLLSGFGKPRYGPLESGNKSKEVTVTRGVVL